MRRELADFLDYCRLERRLAPLTCSAYERDVGACLAFLEREGIVTVTDVRPADLRRFLADEAVRRPAPLSQARTVAAIKCFFRFLLENEQIERDPAQVLRTPRKREALPDVLDRRELARLLETVERDDVWERKHDGKRERDRLLLALFAYAGLRRSELLGLDWTDVDLERRLLKVRALLASYLTRLATAPAARVPSEAELRQAREDWLRRLQAGRRSASAITAYRIAIDHLLDWSSDHRCNVFEEATIADYLAAY